MKELFSRNNKLLEGANETQIKGIVYILCMPIFLSLVGELLELPITIPVFFIEVKEEWIKLDISLIFGTGSVILAYFLWIRLFEKRNFSSIGLKLNKSFFKKYFKGFSIGVLLMLIDTILIIVFAGGKISINNNLSLEVVGIVLLLMFGWLIQGAEEEIIIRGHMMPMLSKSMPVIVSIIISSSYFAILHLGNPNVSILAILNLFLFGASMAVYALKEESIVGVCALHSAWNFTQGNIFRFPVSGLEANSISILNLQVKGNILDGGAFGPEGGLIETIVVIVFIIILIVRYKN